MLSQTESINPSTADIDALSTLEMARRINAEDQKVALAVEAELAAIARSIDGIADRMRRGGRLIYAGAGTSGRLGVLDASEMPPTFNVPPSLVIGVMAGGRKAVTDSIEDVEDDAGAGAEAIRQLNVAPLDSVVGIAASGTTPFVIGALEAANSAGALTISLACNKDSPIAAVAAIAIAPVVGPEVISGSTRLKSGTAQKLVLNMLSTGVMVKLGKTYGNLMVDMQPSNAKLRARAQRIVAQGAGLAIGDAAALLDACDGEVKTAIVSAKLKISPSDARARLLAAGGVTRQALAD